ncbi:MAG: phosphate/phosphite/phosphonate ABC transporter substrate-binding protein [Oryzomonas sp.]|uniref:substrate-binding domain-containing protein n=1 Tax=Oryzomonas sp. TaxID=2855186 RepID=UPI00284C8DA2|nr:phosphate/phosphite/phosphonate ABC transporter substrate-binding protein [Oryzomonas sp.]MDR3579762.1 phosphate/phosphite/phosphonate ABC transporter substrate-binding protein [Oryzomonas sp.]
MKQSLVLVATVIISLIIMACSQKQEAKIVDIDKKVGIEANDAPKEKTLKVAIGGMITPKEGMIYYRDFISYIERKLGIPIEIIDKKSYAEINSLLKSGELSFAFVCSGPYVDGHAKFGLQLLAAPEVNGKKTYNSLIIANSKSSLKSFKELRGKTFAFTDPLSNSGTLIPVYMLAKMNETPKSFFKELIYTQKHDLSIKMASENLVDGAAVDSLIWAYMNRMSPEITSKTRIIEKSPPYAIPPVVVSKSVDPETAKKLSEIFLHAHQDPQGKEILKGMMIDRFVAANDHDYDSIREMLAWTKKHLGK